MCLPRTLLGRIVQHLGHRHNTKHVLSGGSGFDALDYSGIIFCQTDACVYFFLVGLPVYGVR